MSENTTLVSNGKRIEINALPVIIPCYKDSYESKDSLISKWLIAWIEFALKDKKIKENDLLPQKAEMASYLGVSIGTVQSAIRYVEDSGYLISKQKIGTMIVDINNPSNPFRKLTSKREKIIVIIKQYILDKKIKVNQVLPSSRKMSDMLGVSANTTRLAYENLRSIGIIESRFTRGNDANWILKQLPVLTKEEMKVENTVESDTLVSKISDDLKKYISDNFKPQERLPVHSELAETLQVSIKTVHDAMKQLITEGILLARRGRYGTIVLRMPGSEVMQPDKETSIFAKAEDAAFYSYQKVENYVVNLIIESYEVGDKLPAMEELAQKLDVSTNTIRKALKNLSKQGIVQFGRGRYGGTFITDIPEEAQTKSAFRWLAVNPQFVQIHSN